MSAQTSGRTAHAQVAIAATLWGTWSVYLRPARVDARWSAAIMLIVVALATAPLLLRRDARGPSDRRPAEWGWLVVLGFSDALNAGLFFAAMEVTTVAVAVLTHYLAPVLVAALGPTVLRTKRSPRSIPLALMGLCGLTFVLEPWRASSGQGGKGVVLGALLGGGSAVFYAVNVLVTKRIGARFTSEEQLSYHSVLSAALLAIAASVVGAPLPTLRGAAIIAAASIVVGAIAGLTFLHGLRRIPAEHAGILTFLEPVTAVVVAWVFWGERPGAPAALGGALVLLAGVLSVTEKVESTTA